MFAADVQHSRIAPGAATVSAVTALFALALSACGSGNTTTKTTTDAGPADAADAADDSVRPPADAAADAEHTTLPTIEATLTAGARLVPRVWLTSDGDTLPSVAASFDIGDADAFVGQWFDTLLGVDCLFGFAEDGVLRCLPVDYAPVQEAYIDTACSVVGYEYTTTAATRYRTSSIRPALCANQTYRVRRIIGPVAAPTTVYYPSSTGTCVGQAPVANTSTHWASAELVAPTAFVGATTAVVPGAGGLSIVTTVADDGAVERVGLRNAARNEACAPTYVGAESRCLPDVMQAYAQPGYFTDSACQTPSPAENLCASKSYLFANQPLPDAFGTCGVAPSGLVLRAFEPVSGLFQSTMGTCAPAAASPLTIVVQPAAPVPLTDFPVVVTIERGRARLATPYIAPSGGPALVRTGSFHFDSTLNAECRMVNVAGQTRCRPATVIAIEEFTDAACTVPFYRPPAHADCRKPPPGAVLLASTGQSYKVTDRPFMGGTYMVNGTPRGCHASGLSQGLPIVQLDPIPVDQLVEVRPGVE